MWLGKFSFSTILLNPEYTNMTKSGDVCEENTWNHWAAIFLEICGWKVTLYLQEVALKFFLIDNACSWKSSKLIRIYGQKPVPISVPSVSPTMLHPRVNLLY